MKLIGKNKIKNHIDKHVTQSSTFCFDIRVWLVIMFSRVIEYQDEISSF